MLVAIDVIRRLQYKWLCKTQLRGPMGPYVKTERVSCQHHVSNIANVKSAANLFALDCPDGPDGPPALDPFDLTGERRLQKIRGNKSKENLSSNTARFLGQGAKRKKLWRSFMQHIHGSVRKIPVVKSARFWSVLRVAVYLYAHQDFLWEFNARYKQRLRDSQLGSTFDYVEANREFNVHGWQLMGVEYYGFHAPFNKSAANATPAAQARVVHEHAQIHDKLRKSVNRAGRVTFFIEHAMKVEVKRVLQLEVWYRALKLYLCMYYIRSRCDLQQDSMRFKGETGDCQRHTTAGRKQPRTKMQRQARAQELRQSIQISDPPEHSDDRLIAMSSGIYEKLKEFLGELVANGRLPPSVLEAKPTNENFFAEDVRRPVALSLLSG